MIRDRITSIGMLAWSCVVTGFLMTTSATATLVQDWQFNDAVDTQLNQTSNTGTIGTAWNFRLGNPDQGYTDGSSFVFGDDGAGGAGSLPVSADFTRKATFTGDAISSGLFQFEFRIDGWDLDTAPAANNGVTLKLANGGGANTINMIFNIISTGNNVRTRHARSGALGGTASQDVLNGLVSSEGIIVRVEGDLDAGTWSSKWKYDSDLSFTDKVTDGTGFTSIDEIILTVEGDPNAWGAGDHIALDYVSLDIIPEPSTGALMAVIGGALALWRRRR